MYISMIIPIYIFFGINALYDTWWIWLIVTFIEAWTEDLDNIILPFVIIICFFIWWYIHKQLEVKYIDTLWNWLLLFFNRLCFKSKSILFQFFDFYFPTKNQLLYFQKAETCMCVSRKVYTKCVLTNDV